MAMEHSEFVLYSQLYCVHGCVISKAKLKPKMHYIHRCAIFKGVLRHRFLSMTALNPELFMFHGCAVYGHVKSKAMLYLQHCCTNSSVIFIAVIFIAVLYSKLLYSWLKYMFMAKAVLHGWLYYIQSHVCSQLHYIHGSVTNSQIVAVKLYAHCFVTILSNFRTPSDGYGIRRLHRMIQKLFYLMRKPGNTLCTIPKINTNYARHYTSQH